MNRQQFKNEWVLAIDNDTLLTPKHDPNDLSNAKRTFRSVVTHEVSSSLRNFIESDDYQINHYFDHRYNSNYYEITPASGSFSITGGGVPPNTLYTSSHCDRLVIVSGSQTGWHIYAEDSNIIQDMIVCGRLIFSGSL